MMVTILVFLLILSVLVLIHEAGHFFVAKFFNIKIEEFGFGLPPRAFGKKWGETIYSINWLPIGGFVKLYGEDEAGSGKVSLSKTAQKTNVGKDESRAFYSRPVWQRALVVFAGVFMNFVFAVLIISILFSFIGVAIPGKEVIVDRIISGAPAQEAGLKQGDTIVSINSIKIESPDQLVIYTKKHLGENIILEVKDNKGTVKTIEITPRKTYPKGEGPMGVAISQSVVTKKYPIWEAPFVGTREVLNQSVLIGKGLVTVVFQLVTQGSVPKDVAGPVGIAQLTGTVVEIGLPAVLSFVSLLSLNLAIINILPIPALDGGRLLFILIEGVSGRKVSPRFETMAHTIGMAVLLGLIALITIHDLIRILSGQPLIPQIK
ncbi:MAG: RIP metalloprotease RseP [Candidatus Levybacteria bacterium]|nr:RIP metalloprotease RseP [Candidatus Levybacteria bacterium]